MFPIELTVLGVYAREKENEILDVLKDFFVVTSIEKDTPIKGIHLCSICNPSGIIEMS